MVHFVPLPQPWRTHFGMLVDGRSTLKRAQTVYSMGLHGHKVDIYMKDLDNDHIDMQNVGKYGAIAQDMIMLMSTLRAGSFDQLRAKLKPSTLHLWRLAGKQRPGQDVLLSMSKLLMEVSTL
eukprot:1691370-Amphidinium_carterae.1